MGFKFFRKKPRRLGVAENNGRYDLPLHQSAGTHFLILLVALMTFLGMMALSGTFILDGVTTHWSSGLENKITVEIPAPKDNGDLRTFDEIKEITDKIENNLADNPNIKSIEVLSQQDINDLVSPWLGESGVIDDLPLPGLVSMHLHIRSDEKLAELETALERISDDITLDTHEDWLGDILRLAGSLKFSALMITLIIGFTTIIAIAGGIRSRMAEHRADIELLHLMGASDGYITRQLQRHAVVLTLKGSLAGSVFAALVLGGVAAFSDGNMAGGVTPDFSFGTAQIITLILVPPLITLIASQTARLTVLRVLGQMP